MKKLLLAILLFSAPALAQTSQPQWVCDSSGKCMPTVGAVTITQTPPVVAKPATTVQAATTAPATPFAQNISLTAGILTLNGSSGTTAITDVGGTLALSPSLDLRQDSLLGQSVGLTAYLGSIQYKPPLLGFVQKATNLNAKQIQFYVYGGAGIDRVTDPTSGVLSQHIAAQAGGGLNYDPAGNGHFSINLFDIRWARLPGFKNNAVLFSSVIKLNF